MQDLFAFLAIMAIPGVFTVVELRNAWRSRHGPAGSDSGDGAISDRAGSEGGRRGMAAEVGIEQR